MTLVLVEEVDGMHPLVVRIRLWVVHIARVVERIFPVEERIAQLVVEGAVVVVAVDGIVCLEQGNSFPPEEVEEVHTFRVEVSRSSEEVEVGVHNSQVVGNT